ncbi:MAG: NUDIX domain-containing protein [Bacteroidia bacterium]
MDEVSRNNFNVRVYGLIINDQDELLVTDEYCQNQYMTKFPGGGLEFGEGMIDGLKREFVEECGQEVEVIQHFYTTDFFVKSIFRGGGQLISVYYLCRFKEEIKFETISSKYQGIPAENDSIGFRWIPLESLSQDDLTWPVDKLVIGMLKSRIRTKSRV